MDEKLGGTFPPPAPRTGTSPRRPLLGDLLIREGLVTGEQLEQAVEIQTQLREYLPLGQVLVDRGFITREQLEAVIQRYHRKDRLGDILVETNVISEEQLERVLEHHRQVGGRLGETLLKLGLATELQIKKALCGQFQIPFVDLDEVTIDPGLRPLIAKSYAQRHRVVPVAKNGDRLTVALDDPCQYSVVQDLRVSTGCTIEVVSGTAAAYDRAFARLYDGSPSTTGRFITALEQADRERTRREEADQAFVLEARKALADLREFDERLSAEEARHADLTGLIANLRASCGCLSRQLQDVATAMRSIGGLQAQLLEAMGHVQEEQAAIRRERELSSGVLRALGEHCDQLLEERRAIVASLESALSRLRNGQPV